MNFTREIKRELIKTVPAARSGMLALFCGALDTCGSLPEKDGLSNGFCFTGESEDTAAYLVGLAEGLFGVQTPLVEVVRGARQGRDKLTFAYSGTDGGRFAKEILSRGAEEVEGADAECYLKGAFLGGGSCTLPREGAKTGYHLEVVFGEAQKAENYLALLDGSQLLGNIVKRGGKFVVYTKSREAISDFLAVLGAEGAVKTLGLVAAAREENNNENRKENCYAQNADKAAIASAKQILLLEKLQQEGKFALLGPQLLSAAKARLENPELSLSELARKLSISKSCLYHRLRKILSVGKAQKTD